MRKNNPAPADNVVTFVHIPKTAGTTMRVLLARLYAGHFIYALGPSDKKRFEQLPAAEWANIDLVQGHTTYAIRELIPRPTRFITFLRDPVERILSYYYFIFNDLTHYLYEAVAKKKLSLIQFIDSHLTHEIYDYQVRAVAGVEPSALGVSAAQDQAVLDLAKQRLANDFSAFGLTEQFDESLVLLSDALGWSLLGGKVFYESRNVTPNRKSQREVLPEEIAAIREITQLDQQLYEYAQELFALRMRQDSWFRVKLFLFQQMNARKELHPIWRKMPRDHQPRMY